SLPLALLEADAVECTLGVDEKALEQPRHGQEFGAAQPVEQNVVDLAAEWPKPIERRLAGARQPCEHPAPVRRIRALLDEAERNQLVHFGRDVARRDVEMIGERADADAGILLPLRDGGKDRVLRTRGAEP